MRLGIGGEVVQAEDKGGHHYSHYTRQLYNRKEECAKLIHIRMRAEWKVCIIKSIYLYKSRRHYIYMLLTFRKDNNIFLDKATKAMVEVTVANLFG
jgi:hypothetical protein